MSRKISELMVDKLVELHSIDDQQAGLRQLAKPVGSMERQVLGWIKRYEYGLGKPPVTIMDGFFTRNQFDEEYATKSGRDVSMIDYYITFAYFKLAVIGQQIYYRYKNGQTSVRVLKN